MLNHDISIPDIRPDDLSTLANQALIDSNRTTNNIWELLLPRKREQRVEREATQYQLVVNDLSIRFPITREFIQDLVDTRPPNLPETGAYNWGNIPKVYKDRNNAILEMVGLGKHIHNPTLSSREKLKLIRDSTETAEKTIAHSIILTAAAELASQGLSPKQITDLLAATAYQSLSLFNHYGAGKSRYSPITHAENLAKYMRQSKDTDLSQASVNLKRMQENHLKVIQNAKEHARLLRDASLNASLEQVGQASNADAFSHIVNSATAAGDAVQLAGDAEAAENLAVEHNDITRCIEDIRSGSYDKATLAILRLPIEMQDL